MAAGLDMMFRKARGAEKRGDLAEARRLLAAVLASHPNNSTARQALARLEAAPAPGSARVAAPASAGLTREAATALEQLVTAHQRGDHAVTLRLAAPLAARFPGLEAVHTLRGAAALALGDHVTAAQAFRDAVAAAPANAANHNNLGVALRGLGDAEGAARAYADALARAPDDADTLFNLGNLHRAEGRLGEAEAAYGRLLARQPAHVGALYARAALHREARRDQAAVEAYLALLAVAPDHAEGLTDLGGLLKALGHLEEALRTLALATRAGPDQANAWFAYAHALVVAGRGEEAVAAFERTVALAPDKYVAWGQLLLQQAYLCDWRMRDRLATLPIGAARGGGAIVPFAALPFEDDPARQLARSRAFAEAELLPARTRFTAPARAAGGRIRIGYLSADLYDHATMHLISGLLRCHDRSRFEIRAYDFSPAEGHATRARADVEALVDLRGLNDDAAVARARADALDIAIDLKGYTKDSRARLFVERVAPVQIAYLGYPGTLGGDFMDYLVADPVVVPPGAEPGYAEKLIRLPFSYQPNDDQRPILPLDASRAALGLPETGFVFCCFNQGYKIGPREFDIWTRLLREVPGSVLWLLDCGATATANLRREADRRGIDPARLVFAPKLAHGLHLGRQRHADLFLDSFAVNAHTTASDALWGGLPVLTLAGRQFAARVAASLVVAAGLDELVATSEAAYFETALALARDPARLAALRARLATRRTTCPLFDTKGYTRALEAGFAAAWQRHVEGRAPDHIWIAAPAEAG
ncbi:O-linked N-acetylglucosamine transferase family protein [Sphingomonas morindae]|uniref:protein O-GlcNAc transferase n=1 Tax=Sphingomonas morindae TaxID=1541170 RepID=A0ABY4XDM4_9SPHN|nr:tetratricopeptide repeat protein [Sphingomonas morindae]USI75028.1 tetratricopeptide repeat protein [Sphingomonas morindae]